MIGFLPRNTDSHTDPHVGSIERGGSGIRPHGSEAPRNGFERTASSLRAARRWRHGRRAVPGEENVQGLEHPMFDFFLVVIIHTEVLASPSLTFRICLL